MRLTLGTKAFIAMKLAEEREWDKVLSMRFTLMGYPVGSMIPDGIYQKVKQDLEDQGNTNPNTDYWWQFRQQLAGRMYG